ncbi:MAG: hypothetical protein M1816_005950 [Peltula sp. TS41687]|nr:MAG: hypothetical protein M1816_005950 [Peltula sp. TS41687]
MAAVSPPTTPQGPGRPRPNRTTSSREINFTNALAEVLLPRSITRRPIPNKTGNRSPAGADVKEKAPKEEKPTATSGTPLKAFDGNSVRDKVRKWQEEGGGVFMAQDPTLYPSEAASITNETNTDKRTQKDKPGKQEKEELIEVGETANRSRNAKLREGQLKTARVTKGLSPATPKKRVVSDAHWVKKNETVSTPEAKPSAEQPKSKDSPKREWDDDGIRFKGIRTTSARKKQPERETGSPSKLPLDDDGIRVYTTPDSLKRPNPKRARETSRRSPRPRSESEGNESQAESRRSLTPPRRNRTRKPSAKVMPQEPEVSVEFSPEAALKKRPSRGKPSTNMKPREPEASVEFSPEAAPKDRSSRREPSTNMKPLEPEVSAEVSPDEATKNRSRRRRPSPKVIPAEPDISADRSPEEAPKGRADRRRDSMHHRRSKSPRQEDIPEKKFRSKSFSPKVNFLREAYDEGRKIFERPQPQPLPRPPGNRIVAWLDDTPDPFVNAHLPFSEPQPTPELEPARETRKRSTGRTNPKLKNDDDGGLGSSEHRNSGRRHDREGKSSTPGIFEHRGPPESFPTDPTTGYPDLSAPEVDAHSQQGLPVISPMLKRTGAKKLSSSPTGRKRRSRIKETVEEDDRSQISVPDPEQSSAAKVPVEPFREPSVSYKRPYLYAARPQLSTIASVETFTVREEEQAPPTISEISYPAEETQTEEHGSEVQEPTMTETESHSGHNPTLKRRLTHSELMSVLSLPDTTRSRRSARSIKSSRSKLTNTNIADLLNELAEDERNYMRELNTLVDGVIPVLLTCVLSKSDSAIAAGLFGSPSRSVDDQNFTRPIIDMGIALERLRSLHKRIPLQDYNRLLHWAEAARKLYAEYIKCWRMGFQDVVINLAPANQSNSGAMGDLPEPVTASTQEHTINEGLPRNADGDVVDDNGKRVDVAYLLKRPLAINRVQPSDLAEERANQFHGLVVKARHRVNEERGRMEDEAAANIDTSKARDPRTLASLSLVDINPERRVIARDCFDLHLEHSSGQRLDCKVELFFREDLPGKGNSFDLLICEVDLTSRWLLFPPIESGQYSARKGDSPGQLVVMLRGTDGQSQDWHELLSLVTDDEPACTEWLQWLGSHPVPPAIIHQQPFKEPTPTQLSSSELSVLNTTTATDIGALSLSALQANEVPIGAHMEPLVQATSEDRVRDQSRVRQQTHGSDHQPILSTVSSTAQSSSRILETEEKISSLPPATTHEALPPNDLDEPMVQAGKGSFWGKLRRTKAKRIAKSTGESPTRQRAPREVEEDDSFQNAGPSAHPHAASFSEPSSTVAYPLSPSNRDVAQVKDPALGSDYISGSHQTPEASSSSASRSDCTPESGRPYMSRRPSSVPSLDPPTIPKLRRNYPSSHSTELGPGESITQNTATVQASRPTPPSPPVHQSPNSLQIRNAIPNLEAPSAGSRLNNVRRSSSPLKHEYAPSSPSETSPGAQTYSGESSSEEEGGTFFATSDEEELEDGDVPTPLPPSGAFQRSRGASPQGSIYSLPNTTLAPSDSASQTPSNAVPQQPMRARKFIASIYSWADGSWEMLHPRECSIVVTPGLIEAYELGASHSIPLVANQETESNTTPASPAPEQEVRPLVGQELTPLVQLSQGTAVDVSIRSPLIARSKLSAGDNIMFRSRSPEECKALYNMINYARIHNPRYISLHEARALERHSPLPTFAVDRQQRSSRWGWRSRRTSASYQASGGAAPLSENSAGTGTTAAFSAMRLFSSGGRFFNIARSSIGSRRESTSNSLASSSAASSAYTRDAAGRDAPDYKIQLYRRDGADWASMGDARLSIGGVPPGYTQYGFTGQEKRITVAGATAGETLLDACLAGNAFRRIGRTGIAVSIMEEAVGPNGEVGQVAAVGGTGPKCKIYMLQMRTTAQATYIYSLVGLHQTGQQLST